MSARLSEGPFVFNVAGLLGDESGAGRTLRVGDARIELPDELVLATPIAGTIRLLRTNRGVVADVRLTTSLAGECARCLRPLATPIDIRLEEEFLPSLDLTTGRPMPLDEEPEVLRLTDHHEVDLEGPVRDAISLAEPIAPLDRPDCPGLCFVCGLPLDEGTHDHPADDWDPRMEALRAFKPE